MVRPPGFAGIAAKRAVAAVVAAQRGERDEDLGRERDGAPVPLVAQGARSLEDRAESSVLSDPMSA